MLRVAVALLVFAGPALAADVTVLTAGRIHSMDPANPTATAMAWDDSGRLLALGDRATVLDRYPDARRIDVDGATVIPGLIDAHAHVTSLGLALMRADLVGTANKTEVIARLRDFERNLPPGAWLLGHGWDQNDWPEKAYPTAADLDAAFPERSVWLERIDGHAGWANSAAMHAVTRDLAGDWQPDGGRILRAGGKPTGVFIDTAVALVEGTVPPPDAATRAEAVTRALAATAAVGITGVHDMGVSLEDLGLYQQFADAGRLSMRVTAYADGNGAALAALCKNGPYAHGSGRLRMSGVKLFADGALGSRGAALLADYHDEPGQRGLLVTAPAALEAAMVKARDCGVQVATHAIGDRGNRIVLDAYAHVLGGNAAARRWRIEHAQIVSLEDIPRFAKQGVIASMQPTHATSDGPWVETRVGTEGLPGAYAWRRFLDAGTKLAFGSDFPVESVDPRLGLYAAITREDLAGKPPGGWLPDQKLSAAEALRGFTSDAAFAGFAESEVGRLAPGLRADFVVLEGDPLAVPPRAIPDLRVHSTWLDGKPVYRASGRD
jgi:predicted amidohydrolase YtcJ